MRKKRVGIMCLSLVLLGSSLYGNAGQFHQVYANETAENTQTQITTMGVMEFLKLCNPNTLINVTVTEEQAAEMMEVINEVTKDVTKEYDKAKAIYDWVAKEVVYTSSETDTISAQPYDVFIHKRAMCGGFSNLLKEMLNLANIPAVALVGTYSGGVFHQWNAVYVNGEWVYADATAQGFFDNGSILTSHDAKEVLVAKITDGDLELGYYDGLAVVGCNSTSVQIPADYEGHPITSISYTLFGGNYNVQELHINENIISMEESTLSTLKSSAKIKSITVAEGNTAYASREDALFTADLSQLLVYPLAREETEFTLPKETHSFDVKEAFSNPKLQNLYVEEGNAAFSSYDGALYNANQTQLELVPPGKTTITVYGDATISDIALANVDTSKLTIIAKAGSPAADYAKMYHITLREEPEISPKGGEYEGSQQITITTHSDKAKIYYTTDGTEPTKESILYTEPFTIDSNTIIKAFAVEEGQVDSAIVTEEYTIKAPIETTEAPTISPQGGEYEGSQQITITGKSSQAKIYYTTDGTEPTTESTLYTEPFTINSNTTIKAIAIEEGKNQSTVVSQEYKIAITAPVEVTEAPTISPKGGEYEGSQQITITGKSSQAKIYYTTDGTEPTTESTLYTEPFVIDSNTTIKAIAIEEGKTDSAIVTEEYTIKAPIETTEAPTISPQGGEYKEAQQITITGKSEQAKIYYTTNGTEPTTESTLYTEPFTIDSNTTIKAIAIEEGKYQSTVVSQEYKIAITAPVEVTEAPTISPQGGEYKEAQQITITGKSSQAKIYYTTDGTEPTTESTLYTEPFTIDSNTTIKAIAIEEGKNQSTVVSQEYKIAITAPVEVTEAPTISPQGGEYQEAQQITITGKSSQAKIYYTTDGTEPTTESTLYTEPFTINSDTTIKAIAIEEGKNQSTVVSQEYKITIKAPVEVTEAPTISPQGGEYQEAQQITITGKSSQAKIYYTTDGTEPTTESTLYTEPFTLNSNTTLKAIAIEEGKNQSMVVTEEYQITIKAPIEKQQVAAPVIRPEGGTFTSAQEITMVSATENAVIYYTTDGSNPTAQSTKYTVPVKLTKSATVRAIAVKDGWKDSEVTTAVYVIEKPWIFTDVAQNGGWKHLAVKYVYENDIMGAVGASQEFQPDNPLTRAMFATVLYRMAGSPKVDYTAVFEDVPQGMWFSDAVIWAYRNKIVSGVGDGSSYGIDLNITREQIAKMLCEYANTCKYDTTAVKALDQFTDVSSVSSWAVKYMQWAVAVEMITGKPNDDQETWRMDPKGNATRAECAAMLQRFADRYIQ